MSNRIFEWHKSGHIYSVTADNPLTQSHAQVPVAEIIDDSVMRIYYSSRDEKNKSRIFSVDLSSSSPYEVIQKTETPLLDLGPLGSFDDSGVMPTWIVARGNEKYLYYIGWNSRDNIPYHNSIGLAISKDGGESFEKAFAGPIIDRSTTEPYFCGTACVIFDEDIWKNWYLSCTGWVQGETVAEPLYHIKYAESADGIHWDRKGSIAIEYKDLNEGGIVKASVLRFKEGYSMWYAYRNKLDFRKNTKNSYRIGYAESLDGMNWTRMDDSVGIDISEDGWDSEMIAYPHVLPLEDKLLMFYNGNGFGASGFGLAIAQNNYTLVNSK